MNVTISRPSTMDAKIVADKGASPDDLMVVKPRRYSKGQRKITLFPFSVILDTAERGAFPKSVDGMVDQGFIVLDVRTGKISIEHRLEEVPVVVEKK